MNIVLATVFCLDPDPVNLLNIRGKVLAHFVAQ
jgi:hypothetical protein